MKNISKKLFFLLVLFLPINLGKHFELEASYVWGLLVDYLVPVVFVQDLLVLVILLFWIIEKGFPKKKKVFKALKRREIQVLVFFLFSVFLSTLSAQKFIPSIYFFLKTLLYTGLFLYVIFEVKIQEDFPKILEILALDVVFLGVLGILQYIRQGSVFNDYLFLGEQPYSVSTWGIAKENVLESLKVASYGLFRHPNTFGGFLAVILVWIFAYIKKRPNYFLAFLLGFVALIFTFSYTSWAVLVLGFLVYFISRFEKGRKNQAVFLIWTFSIVMFLLPFFGKICGCLSENPSFYRRANSLSAVYRIIKQKPLFGVGANNLTAVIDAYMPKSPDLRFTQPAHNVFGVVFSESGIFAFAFFILLMFLAVKKAKEGEHGSLLLPAILQILFLASLDHYFYTIHQTQLLFWIILGLSFA